MKVALSPGATLVALSAPTVGVPVILVRPETVGGPVSARSSAPVLLIVYVTVTGVPAGSLPCASVPPSVTAPPSEEEMSISGVTGTIAKTP